MILLRLAEPLPQPALGSRSWLAHGLLESSHPGASQSDQTLGRDQRIARSAARVGPAAIRILTADQFTQRRAERRADFSGLFPVATPFLVEKITKRHGRQLICNNEECSYVRSEELAPA